MKIIINKYQIMKNKVRVEVTYMSNNKEINKNKWQKIVFVLLGGGLGVLLLLFGGGIYGGKESDDEQGISPSVYDDANAYAQTLERRVADICSSVEGAGEVKVFVSLKGGYRTVYAVDSQSNSTGYKNEIVMSGSGSDKSAVICAYENPEIAGVGIVCSGAQNAQTREKLVCLVSSALNIGTNKIFVTVGNP